MSNYGMNGSGDAADGDRFSGRGRGRGNSPGKQDELRRPHQHPAEIAEQAAQRTEMVKNSTLSPNAQEFVPRAFVANPVPTIQTQHSVQNRIQAARSGHNPHQNNVYQQQMMQQNYYPQNQYHRFDQMVTYNYNEQCSNDQNSVNQRKNNETPATDLNVTISQMESSIRILTMSPGEFDRLVSHLVDIINPFLENPSQLKEIISVIIKQSINEGNFRYNGARLCTYLDTVANPTERATSTFRDILLQQCEEEKEAQSTAWQRSPNHTDEDAKKCHGLIMFLAELVTQMQSSAPTLGKMLIQLISTVLHTPAPSSAKNICQALKLAGQTLERGNASAKKDMEAVMRQLTDLVMSGRVDSQVGRMVDSVSELRNNSWGRAPTIAPAYRPPMNSQQNAPARSHEALDEPVFYGPDGKVMSAEETAFMHNFAGENKEEEYIGEYNDPDYDPDEEEEDDMIAAAYEEFLKLSDNGSTQIKN